MNSFVSVKQNQIESVFQFIQEIEALILPEDTGEEASNQAPFVLNKRAFYSKQIVQQIKSLKQKKEKKREILQLDSWSPGYIDKYLKDHGSVMISPFSHHFISEIQHHLTQKEFKDLVHFIESTYSQTIGRHYFKEIKLHILLKLQGDDREQEQVLLEVPGEEKYLNQKGYTREYLATHEAKRFWIVKTCLKKIEDQLKQKKKSEWIQSFKEFSDFKKEKESVFQFVEQIEKTILPDYINLYENETLNSLMSTYLPKQHFKYLIEQEEKSDKLNSFCTRCLLYLKAYPFYLPFACSYSETIKVIQFIINFPTLRSQTKSSKKDLIYLDLLQKSLHPNSYLLETIQIRGVNKQRSRKKKRLKQILHLIPLSQLNEVQLFVRLLIVTKRDPLTRLKEVKEKVLLRIGCHYLLKIKEEIRNDKFIQFNSQDLISDAYLCIKELEKKLSQKKKQKKMVKEEKSKKVHERRERYNSGLILCAQFYLKKVKEKLLQNEMKQKGGLPSRQIVQQMRSSLSLQNQIIPRFFLRFALLVPGYIEKYLDDHKNVKISRKSTPLVDDIQHQLTQKESLDLVQEVESACLLRIGRHYLKQIKQSIKPPSHKSFLKKDSKDSRDSNQNLDSGDYFDQKEFCDTFQFFQQVANLPKYTERFAKKQDPVVVQNFVISCSQLIVKQMKSLEQKEYGINPIFTKHRKKHKKKKNHGSVTPLRLIFSKATRSFTLLSYQTWLLALHKDSMASEPWQRAFEKLSKAEREFMEYSQQMKSSFSLQNPESLHTTDQEWTQFTKKDSGDGLRLDTIKSQIIWIAIKNYVDQYLNDYKLVYPLCKDRNLISEIQQKVTQKEEKDLVQEVRSACLLRIGCHYLKQIKQNISKSNVIKKKEIFPRSPLLIFDSQKKKKKNKKK